MKYTIETEQKAFEPITITITLESLEELKSMWARMNMGNGWTGGYPSVAGAWMESGPIWDELDTLLKERTK